MLEFVNEWGVWALFLSAFLASTIIPGGSEAILALLAANKGHDPWTLLWVATLGNTLGGMSSWLIGRLIAWRYPAQAMGNEKLRRAVQYMQKWGSPLLLFSWLPIIGDPLCVAAGWLRIHGGLALLFIAIGKAARYAAILLIV